jgi:transposase-like protein
MERGTPIKVIASKLGISIQTSFDWRHKILSSLEQFVPDNLADTLECDELEFSLSNKGDRNLDRKPRKRANDFKRNKDKGVISTVQVVTAVERNTGHKFFKVVESKRLTKDQISKVLDGKIKDGAILITDKHPSYKAYVKDNDQIKHKRLLAKEHVDKKDKTTLKMWFVAILMSENAYSIFELFKQNAMIIRT